MGLVDKKIALVTGGGQGIGEAITLRLAAEGASVAVLDINLEKAQAVADKARALGVDAEAFRCDVSNTEAVKLIVDEIVKRFGRIDVLVNNAGITRDQLILKMTEQDWDLVMSINLKGIFNFTKAVSRVMMKARTGSIINISSVVGLFGNAGQMNYAASKAGAIGATKAAAKELASRNIRVNAVAPGYIDTAMTHVLSDEAKASLLAYVPAKRLGTAEDVANGVLFLASDLSSYVTGETLRVDGGMAM